MNTNVLDYGAKAHPEELCTKEMQAAIDACYASGGGIVTVPAGFYRTGTLWLRSNVELHLEHGATIKGSDNLDDYNAEDAYEQNFSSRANEKWLGKHLIIAHECENVAITGTGTIDGNGDIFMGEAKSWSSANSASPYVWREGCRQAKDDELCRPGQLICFIECRRVTLRDITVTNQPAWGCFFHGCEYVTIRGLKTFNQHTIFNSDGIDLDCCKYVTVSDCLIDTGDDCIAIRGNGRTLKYSDGICEHITISNCVLGSCSSSIRVGVGKGTIRHVRVSNLCITRGAPAIQIMSSYNGKGNTTIDDISFTNLSMTNCSRPFEITEGSLEKATVTNIVVENVRAEVFGFVNFKVTNTDTVKNITLRNWSVKMIEGPEVTEPGAFRMRGTVWFRGKNARNLTLDQFAVYDDGNYLSKWNDGLFSFENCENLKLQGITLNDQPVKF